MQALTAPAHARGLGRRQLTLVSTLALVVFGMLAMHMLIVLGPHAQHTHAVAPTDAGHRGSTGSADPVHVGAPAMTVVGHVAEPAGTSPCGDDCGAPDPGHSMVMMGCVLALLASVVTARGPRPLYLLWMIPLRCQRVIPMVGAVLRQPRPPSPIALSISRT